MKETKYYCDACGLSRKELNKDEAMIAFIRMYSEPQEREIHLCKAHYENLKRTITI